MNIQELRKVIAHYISLDDNDDFATQKCWDKMTDMLSEDVSATISFFKSDCTIEELYWISSIFEDIAAKTQSKELISIWRARLSTISATDYKQNEFKSELMRTSVKYPEYIRSIEQEIDFAEAKVQA